MKEVSKELFEFLNGLTDLTAIVGTRIYPIMAKENVTFPFATYTIGEVPYITKDGREFPITISVYFQGDHATTAMEVSDFMKYEFENSDYDFVSSEISSNYETGIFYTEINIIKIK